MPLVKHIVLTGASGFLGKHLLHSFLTNDYYNTPRPLRIESDNKEQQAIQYKIHALYGGSHPNFDQAVKDYAATVAAMKVEDDPKANQPHPPIFCVIQTYSLDLTDPKAIDTWLQSDEVMKQVDCIHACVHMAAVSNPGSCQANPEFARSVNIPKHFFNAICEQKHCRCIIALSTDHVYPGTNPPYREEEDRQRGGIGEEEKVICKPINMYGSTKYEMERFLLSISSSTSNNTNTAEVNRYDGCRVILLRSSIILGPTGPIALKHSKSTFLHFIATRKDEETLFWTDEKRNVIWVGDVVAVIRWFIDDNDDEKSSSRSSGVYNMGGPQSLSRFEMAQAVFDHLGYDPRYVVAKEKGQKEAQNPSQGAPSPLDISMDSTKLYSLTQIKFSGFTDILKSTFGT